MDDDRPEDLAAEIRTFVRALVARGDRTFADVLDETTEYFLESYDDQAELVEQISKREIERAFFEHIARQATWPDVTDCDRLDRAFEALNAGGIVARHDFTCCQNCGFAEIGAEIEAALEAGVDVSGFTFYHQQDTDSATEGGGLYLSYGHVDGGDANAIAVGRVIESALNAAGLETVWDGTVGQRIHVRLTWQRRVSPAQAAVPSAL